MNLPQTSPEKRAALLERMTIRSRDAPSTQKWSLGTNICGMRGLEKRGDMFQIKFPQSHQSDSDLLATKKISVR